MTAAAPTREGEDPEWEWAPLRIPASASRVTVAAQLSLQAEYGGWELARVVRYFDGTRRVLLRRRVRPSNSLPLPKLSL